MSGKIITPPSTPAYREGWDRVFGFPGRPLWIDISGKNPNAADDPQHGLSPDKPFATPEYAYSRAVIPKNHDTVFIIGKE